MGTQTKTKLDPVDKENAEYPFAHVHTMGGDDVDPLTREPVNILKGYAQKSFVSLDPVDKENAEYPFAHVHTMGGDDVDPLTREPVNILKGYCSSAEEVRENTRARSAMVHVMEKVKRLGPNLEFLC